eukprot:4490197-Pleurochrysis_carterae.AAC.1
MIGGCEQVRRPGLLVQAGYHAAGFASAESWHAHQRHGQVQEQVAARGEEVATSLKQSLGVIGCRSIPG